jgi:dTDP-4-dehydrorhamnose reductase
VLLRYPAALIVRTSAFFGPAQPGSFVRRVLNQLALGPAHFSANEIVSPTYVPDLAHAVLDLLIDAESGIWHLANQGSISWYDWARWIAESAQLHDVAIYPQHGAVKNTVLSSERGLLLPSFNDAAFRYLRDFAAEFRMPPSPPVNALQPTREPIVSSFGQLAG